MRLTSRVLGLGLVACCLLASLAGKEPGSEALDLYRDGTVCYDKADYAGAIGALDEAIRSDDRFAAAYLARAWAKLAARDEKGAIADAVKAHDLSPEGISPAWSPWTMRKGIAPQADLTGTYVLCQEGDLEKKPVTVMTVSDQRGGVFLIGGEGQNWEAHGAVDGKDGFYEWNFGDGRSGRTDFRIAEDGTLRGHVLERAAGKEKRIDWHYVARRVEGPVRIPGR